MKTFIQNIAKSIFLLIAICNLQSALAQAPQKMSYQAVIRNASNALVTNAAVGMRISILQGSATGTEIYKEIYNPNPQTNANGLLTLEIGSGLVITGTFATIDWSASPYFIKTETDPAGGTNYTITGTSQLLSVPYALASADNKWTANGTNISNNNSGNIGIGTNTPTTKLEINGFTKLGSNAPAIKTMILTGTTAATQGGTVNIYHGLNPANILSVSVLVNYYSNNYVPPSFRIDSSYDYDYYIISAFLTVFNSPASSSGILSKPIKILITYKE